MNPLELSALLADIESDRAERTISGSHTDKFGEAICAFSNDLPRHGSPGYLFVGATPEGHASGLAITDQLLQNLAAIRSDGNVQPLPRMNVQKHALGGGEMAVVEVFPSDLPPVRYKGTVWVRVGPSRRIAHEADERALTERRAQLAKTWDAQPCRESTIADLVLELFSAYRANAISAQVISANHRSIEEQLGALRFFDSRYDCPTNAGILLFAKTPTFFFAGALVRYLRYEGADQAAVVAEERTLDGDLLTVMRDLDSLAKSVAGSRPLRSTELSEQTVYNYPPVALHELFMNAVIHRDYASTAPTAINHFADRIEILNPGGLYGDLSPEFFPRGVAYRNPVLAEAAKVLGFVNRYGRGIAVVQDELKRNGSEPAFLDPKSSATHFLAVVKRRA